MHNPVTRDLGNRSLRQGGNNHWKPKQELLSKGCQTVAYPKGGSEHGGPEYRPVKIVRSWFEGP